MNKKAKAQLLNELAQLDVERQAIFNEYIEGWQFTGPVMERMDAFRDRLCEVLGIQEYSSRIESFTTDEPILGGDVGVTTTIYYQLGMPGGDTYWPYGVTMSYEGLEVQYTSPMAVDLPTMLHRGYAALRVLRKGTINYHKS
jgi:hypothetical protein